MTVRVLPVALVVPVPDAACLALPTSLFTMLMAVPPRPRDAAG